MTSKLPHLTGFLLLLIATGGQSFQTSSLVAAEKVASEKTIDFNRDIRPILFNNCIKCHGPDEAERHGGGDHGLRLDTFEGATEDLDGSAAVTPGDPDKSELIARITSDDPDLVMPPASSGKKLTEGEVTLLRRWIAEGGTFSKHWSYSKPARPELPEVRQTDWPRNPIDRFILSRLEQEQLPPSPELERAALARRVSLDLTGLPPTRDELERFLTDQRTDAYERFVDQLLSKPGFGEHWAHQWLDLARYADSAGYADDPARIIWRYRDYVIRSFNENKPFDTFTIEQIAGDLLPNPTTDQIIATAFHRNTMTNNEGGTDDEEFRNVAVVDRVNTTFSVWMGTTMACAQCHTHKFDPITHAEYFGIFAILNNTKDADRRDESPLHSEFLPDQIAQRERVQQQLKTAKEELHRSTPDRVAAINEWAASDVQLPEPVQEALKVSAEKRTLEQQQLIIDEFIKTSPTLKTQRERVDKLQKQFDNIKPVTVPIQEELPADQQRVTRIHIRGNFQNLGDVITPGFPEAFHPLRSDLPANRLGLAHWLVDAENPLTPRVVSNRYWEQIFGTGLVSTSEDFGVQGELPSHPELLDWLATELVRANWDTKAFLKLLVTSATYRQSSQMTPEQYETDPDNRLLARGPRFRLSAEMIRDQALALSGLLSPKMSGPPVNPLQPSSGLAAAFGGKIDWATSQGEDKFRRGIYTSWRRSNPYPSMATFDAPNREVCIVRRGRTNTPLQALVTLNDPVYIEAAQALARRVITEGGVSPEDRARFVLQLCLCRSPRETEVSRLVELYSRVIADYQKNSESAKQMATDPLGPLPENTDLAEAATWTIIANVVLNLDELIMKR